MRVIDRIFEYLKHHHITPYAFERTCGIANGYLKKQTKGKGTVGSEILEKIGAQYKDLSLVWLITGTGKMLPDSNHNSGDFTQHQAGTSPEYPPSEQIVQLLKDKISIYENALSDKDKIINLLEQQTQSRKKSH